MKIRKNIIFVLLALIFVNMLSCSYKDPEMKTINEDYSLATIDGKVALFKHNGDEGDEIIVCKNFVAYSLVDGGLVLCEESDENTQTFWYYDLNSDSSEFYENYSELISDFESGSFSWTPLWVKDFNIKG